MIFLNIFIHLFFINNKVYFKFLYLTFLIKFFDFFIELIFIFSLILILVN